MSALTGAATASSAFSASAAAEEDFLLDTDLPTAAPRRLRAVDPRQRPQRRRKPRVLYGVVAVAGAIAIGAAQMGLSILTTQSSYELSGLRAQQRDLTWQKQILTDDVAGLSSPQFLAANASALGMVINESPSYLRLSDGAILGTGDAAAGTSTIDALGRGLVPNSLITDTPLVTSPTATIEGVPAAPVDESVPETDATTPPPISDGLPSPTTH